MKKLLLVALAFLGLGVLAQAAQTTVTDTIHTATGALAQGVITVTPNQQFTTTGGIPVYPIATMVNIVNGVFTINLYPNDATSDPLSGTSYTARYALNNQVAPVIVETWVVPTSGSPVGLEAVRTNPTPVPAAVISLNQLSSGGGSPGQCLVLGSLFWAPGSCGSGITQLTGDVTAGPGSGSQVATLATVNVNVGNCGDATHVCQVALDAKGRVLGGNPIAITGTTTAITALTGDGTATGPGSVAFTLATVNSNVGSFGGSTAIPVVTVNGKGLVTAISTAVVIAPAGTLSGTTLNSAVVTSSLTSVGTLTSLTMGGDITISTHNLITDTVTGTKIGTATGQKLGFYNATPVIQQSGDVLTALSTYGFGTLTIGAGDLPLATTGAFGAVKCDGTTITCTAGVIAATTGGGGTVTTTGSPASGNLTKFSGGTSITNGDISGDATTSGTLALTLATVNANTGTCGDASHYAVVILNGKGLATGCSGGAVCGPFSAQTDGATVTWAIGSQTCNNANLTFTTHGGSRTLNLTGLVNGGSYVLWIKQDATGGEGLTLGTGCTWKVSNGGGAAITTSTAANAVDVLAFTYDGTNCYANFNKNFT